MPKRTNYRDLETLLAELEDARAQVAKLEAAVREAVERKQAVIERAREIIGAPDGFVGALLTGAKRKPKAKARKKRTPPSPEANGAEKGDVADALAWARANPDDPRAAKILEHHGAK